MLIVSPLSCLLYKNKHRFALTTTLKYIYKDACYSPLVHAQKTSYTRIYN